MHICGFKGRRYETNPSLVSSSMIHLIFWLTCPFYSRHTQSSNLGYSDMYRKLGGEHDIFRKKNEYCTSMLCFKRIQSYVRPMVPIVFLIEVFHPHLVVLIFL